MTKGQEGDLLQKKQRTNDFISLLHNLFPDEIGLSG